MTFMGDKRTTKYVKLAVNSKLSATDTIRDINNCKNGEVIGLFGCLLDFKVYTLGPLVYVVTIHVQQAF